MSYFNSHLHRNLPQMEAYSKQRLNPKYRCEDILFHDMDKDYLVNFSRKQSLPFRLPPTLKHSNLPESIKMDLDDIEMKEIPN